MIPRESPIPTPTVADLCPGVMSVVVTAPPDDLGIARFTAFWLAGDSIAEGKVRGQVFHAKFVEWVRRQIDADWAVEGLDEASTAAVRAALAATADRLI